MKKLNLLFTLIIALLVSTVVMVSCSKKSVQENGRVDSTEVIVSRNQVLSDLSPEQIAEYHNIAVEFYLSKYGGERHTIGDVVNLVIELMYANYPKLMDSFVLKDEDNFLLPFYSEFCTNTDVFNKIMEVGFEAFKLNGDVSQKFFNDIKQLTLSGNSFESIMNQLLNYEVSTEYERNSLEIYKHVLIASNNLWNVDGVGVNELRPLKCSSYVIAADALGSLAGSAFGPWGTIIVGAVYSIASNEAC